MNILDKPPAGLYERTNELSFRHGLTAEETILIQKWVSLVGDPAVWVKVPISTEDELAECPVCGYNHLPPA